MTEDQNQWQNSQNDPADEKQTSEPVFPNHTKPENEIPASENAPEQESPRTEPSSQDSVFSAPPNLSGASIQTTQQDPIPPKKPKKNRKNTGWIVLLTLLYLVLVGGLIYSISSGILEFARGTASNPETTDQTEETETEEEPKNAPIVENPSEDGNNPIVGDGYTGDALATVSLYENNVDCVVFVEANYRQGKSTGSGFVIDSQNGYILTNHHVVDGSEDLAVTFVNGDSYTATLVGGDAINDVAVIKISAEGLKHVTIGNSDNIKVGSDVLVIGNPLGDLTFTLTKGIVSAVKRTINTGEYNINTFQTDAAINSGNSGGPAFDSTGAVIGIASAKYAATGVEGIGFCIPINDAMAIAKDLVAHGYVTGRPNFGITVSDSLGYEYTTDAYGRRVRVETALGARVEEVGKSSCAAKAGIQVGDIITKLGDTKITTANGLINAKNSYKAGDTVTLELYRDGKTVTVTVVLDEYTP